MFESREGKQLKENMLVAIHFNSTRKDYSVLEMKSFKTLGKVIGYISKGVLMNGYSLIGKSGQANVRQSKKKNRHSFLVGYWKGFEHDDLKFDGRLYYNPLNLETNCFIDYDLFFNENKIKEINTSYYYHFDLIGKDKEVKPLIKYIL
jgi:hypothetical protein